MNTPWLSLLIPVYKVEPWLGACLESIRAQAAQGIEVVLLDDASPDGSGALARRLIQDLPQARVLVHPKNRGLSAARNSLLAEARGEYVWFLDSDDVLLPGSIQSLRHSIEQGSPDLVLCDFRVVRERTRTKHRLRGELHRGTFAGTPHQTRAVGPELLAGLLKVGQLHSWSKIARRVAWQGAPFPEGRYYEDIAVIAALVAQVGSYRYVPETWVGYRQREGSILASSDAAKLKDLLHNACTLRSGAQELQHVSSPAASFALDHFCLRTMLTSLRLAAPLRSSAPELDAEIRTAFSRLLPDAGAAVLQAYLRRGWWWRWLRARARLRRWGLVSR
ncbi:glycosyltransferase family 2 protein [Aquimonas sp.]|uniref:glycosyltransferase family 2 protein n=1 Tax=Aquimonas sp. TaxID=1872588 RepID=UPI0037C0E165